MHSSTSSKKATTRSTNRRRLRGAESSSAGDTDPFEFDFEPPTHRPRAESAPTNAASLPAASEDAAVGATPTTRRGATWSLRRRLAAAIPGRPRTGLAREPLARRSARERVAIATGVVLAGIAVGCFESGPVGVLVLATVAITLAAGETFGALRRSGYRPLSFLGLVATAALVVFSYLKGPIADPVVLAGLVVLVGLALVISSAERSAVEDFGATMLVVTWVGVLGSFAATAREPDDLSAPSWRRLLGCCRSRITVAHDVGSYVVGSRFGRRRFVRRGQSGQDRSKG